MKKITLLLIAFVTILSGCTNSSTTNRLTSENDSLRNVIAERDAALEEVVNTINAVEEGFDAINEAYGRVNLDAASAEQSKMAKLKKDISFINETLDSNRKRIAELEEQLKTYEKVILNGDGATKYFMWLDGRLKNVSLASEFTLLQNSF